MKSKKKLLEALEFLEEHAIAYAITQDTSEVICNRATIKIINRAEWVRQFINEVKK